MTQTLKLIKAEAQRRVLEDCTSSPRIVYMTAGGRLGICLLDEFEERPALDLAVADVWEKHIETI